MDINPTSGSYNNHFNPQNKDMSWQEALDYIYGEMDAHGTEPDVFKKLQDYWSEIHAQPQTTIYNSTDIEAKVADIEGKSPEDPNKKAIKTDFDQSQKVVIDIQSKITSLQSKIQSLEKQIANLEEGPTKEDAQQHLDALKWIVSQLNDSLSIAQGKLTDLSNLTKLDKPSDTDVANAATDLYATNQAGTNANTAYTSAQAHIAAIEKDLPSPVVITGGTCYINLDPNGGSGFDMQSLIDKLKASGISNMILSFSQIGDDLSPLDPSGHFKEAISEAHAAGMSVGLAFGGALGKWDPQTATIERAHAIAQFAIENNLNDIDFDDETFEVPSTDFFRAIHNDLEGHNIPMTITVTASPYNSALGPFKDIFEHFDECFDGLNLMMYNGQQYLDKSQVYLQEWMDAITKPGGSIQIDLSKIHIGFTDYTDNWSGRYPGDGTQGQNAARVYKEALANLKPPIDASQLGSVFWWPRETGGGYPGDIAHVQKMIDDFNEEMQK